MLKTDGHQGLLGPERARHFVMLIKFHAFGLCVNYLRPIIYDVDGVELGLRAGVLQGAHHALVNHPVDLHWHVFIYVQLCLGEAIFYVLDTFC